MSEMMRRRMQEKLDGLLAEEQVSELLAYLNLDETLAEEYARLEQVDILLSNPPQVRAPNRLAATIMARLAASAQQEVERQRLDPEVQQALQLSLSLVNLAMMPMIIAASWLVLNAHANPQLLTRVLERVIALQVMMLHALDFLLAEVEELVERDPQRATLAFSLIPVVLLGMLEYVQGGAPDAADDAAADDA